jgi:hypothetical protein
MKWLIAMLASMTVLVASAIEVPKNAPAKPPAKEAPAPKEPAKDDPATAAPATATPSGEAAKPADTPAPEPEEEALPPLPPDTVPSGPPPQRFNPTEKVRADFPVSFPIDI